MAVITAKSGFLETVQVLRGEELTSAVLGYLIANSPIYYRAFLECLGLSPEDYDQYPESVSSEVATVWEFDGDSISGRLDLLIDTGTRLIGIENKIWAPFMEHQPLKYCKNLIDESRYLNRPEGPLLVVLVGRLIN